MIGGALVWVRVVGGAALRGRQRRPERGGGTAGPKSEGGGGPPKKYVAGFCLVELEIGGSLVPQPPFYATEPDFVVVGGSCSRCSPELRRVRRVDR